MGLQTVANQFLNMEPLEHGVANSGKSVSNHGTVGRSEEHTSELQSPVPISYAVFCLKKKKKTNYPTNL